MQTIDIDSLSVEELKEHLLMTSDSLRLATDLLDKERTRCKALEAQLDSFGDRLMEARQFSAHLSNLLNTGVPYVPSRIV